MRRIRGRTAPCFRIQRRARFDNVFTILFGGTQALLLNGNIMSLEEAPDDSATALDPLLAQGADNLNLAAPQPKPTANPCVSSNGEVLPPHGFATALSVSW
jgi:hypothetical protein